MEPPSSNSIAILNQSGRRLRHTKLREAVLKTLELHDKTGSFLEILLANDDVVRDLNGRFRGKDETTDVLTFPAPSHASIQGEPHNLGEVAISVPYAERQAAARSVGLETELAYLAIHGTLHLLGFEDETQSGHRRMLEEMHRAGIASGLKPEPQWSSILHEGAA